MALLAHTLSSAHRIEFTHHLLLPMGSTSRIVPKSDARTAYEKKHRYGRTSRTQQHTGFVTPEGGPVDRQLPPDELCLIAVRAMLKAGSFAAAFLRWT